MSAEETILNAEAANTEIDLGLRRLNTATDSQRAFAASAHEIERIKSNGQQIESLLNQLPTGEVYAKLNHLMHVLAWIRQMKNLA